ncbi:MAG: M3 family oligoendopeptidase [Symbiobacteriaceae bacterium]|nr:M3 family oligoendopeptidase [Symbiobacteriaceae bacterium]
MPKLENLHRIWDLDTFFPGGPASPEYVAFLDLLEQDLLSFTSEIKQPTKGVASWIEHLQTLDALTSRTSHARAFINCHASVAVTNPEVRVMESRFRQVGALLATVDTTLNDKMLQMPLEEWTQLVQAPELASSSWALEQRRQRAKTFLPPEQEAVVNALSVNGFQGWNALYFHIIGSLSIEVEVNGEKQYLSAAQLQNRLDDPDPHMRAYYMDVWDRTWDEAADTIALELNNMVGFRLNLYRLRGWDDFLFETLRNNLIQKDTLDSMQQAICQQRPRLVAYLKRKKELLGLASFGWQDVTAQASGAATKLSYDEAANFIVENFAKHSPGMAEMAEIAFRDRWIESEDRPGKRVTAFCSGFPEAGQSRIFVNFSGTMGSTVTIAHELGHAYNSWVLKGTPQTGRLRSSCLGETASIFAETLVGNAGIAAAGSEDERLSLIESKLNQVISMSVNMVARYLFDRAFHEERTKGEVSVARLNQLMLAAQREAYGDALDRWHPTLWASKQHYHGAGNPFYNYPYTFGQLFANGVFAYAMQAGDNFEKKYNALLRDTGRCTVEELAMRHLGADLTKPDFWHHALNLALAELDEWLEKTKKKVVML